MKRVLRAVGLGLLAALIVAVAATLLVYPPQYVYRVVAWQESDAFDWQKFPSHLLRAAAQPYHFETAPDPRVPELLARLAGTSD